MIAASRLIPRTSGTGGSSPARADALGDSNGFTGSRSWSPRIVACQIGILIGAMTSALVIGLLLNVFNNTATIYAKADTASCRVVKCAMES